MTKTRLAAAAQPKKGPGSPIEWERLLHKVTARVRLLGNDRVLRALEAARHGGRGAQCLRKMSIISEADLEREFPAPSK